MQSLPTYLIHYHAPEWCRRAVASILASTGVEIDLVVLNNGGELTAPVPIWQLERNLGYAGAANVAVIDLLSRGAKFGLVGAHDVQVRPDTIERLLDVAHRRPEYGILGPSLAEHGIELGREADVVRYDWVSGTLMLLRRECLDDIGGFDPLYGSYVEDVDLCFRAQASGWRVGSVTGAYGRGLGSRDPFQARTMTHANHLLLELKAREYGRAGRRLAGLLARAASDPICRAALPLALRQASRLVWRGLTPSDAKAPRPRGVPQRPRRNGES